MNELGNNWIDTDEWASLKAFTDARIALGKTGVSVPLRESLAFKLAHAHAKDAVYSVLDVDTLESELGKTNLGVYRLHSRAENRDIYLQRPDLGRRLDERSVAFLNELNATPIDISIILADGLSATALNEHAVPVVAEIITLARKMTFSLAPLMLVEQGRVAIADEIGSLLQAQLTIMLIGERPGLSASDSIGAYLTYAPEPGLTDERRNCVSNIRPHGLSPVMAAEKIMYLVEEAFRLKLTGVALKDNATAGATVLPPAPAAQL